MTNEENLFPDQGSPGIFQLIYAGDRNTMSAKNLGEALVGMDYCMRQAAKITHLDFDDVHIFPIQEGSVKSILVYIKKNPRKVLQDTNNVSGILSLAILLIGSFGANNFKIPSKDILEAVSDKRVLDLCQGYEFRKALQKIAEPVSEYNKSVKFIFSEKTVEINCENKYQYYVDKENEQILPDLVNGQDVILRGRIFRINTDYNDLGFKYKGRNLSVTPINTDESSAQFHKFLENKEVNLRGIIVRDSMYEVPTIRVIEVSEYKDMQGQLFNSSQEVN